MEYFAPKVTTALVVHSKFSSEVASIGDSLIINVYSVKNTVDTDNCNVITPTMKQVPTAIVSDGTSYT